MSEFSLFSVFCVSSFTISETIGLRGLLVLGCKFSESGLMMVKLQLCRSVETLMLRGSDFWEGWVDSLAVSES